MKRNGKKVLAMLLLAVVAVGSYYVSGTYAKYSRALSGTDTATVAKFSVSGTGLNKEGTATFDLFGDLKEENITDPEDNVLATKIAPGTGGVISTTLTNDSEVDVVATLKLTETNAKKVPVEYKVEEVGGTAGEWKTLTRAEDGSATEVDLGTVELDYVGKSASAKTSKEVKIYWRWDFDGDDTALGEMETLPTVDVTVKATFDQVK